MPVWQQSKMSTLYYSNETASEDYPCIVEITEEKISVKYDYDGFVEYSGRNDGSGHFELFSPQVNGKASLHMFPDSIILEGHWIEDGYRGMWQIFLN